MNKDDLQRLVKLEDRINRIATEEMGLTFIPIEWDVVPPQKMMEIMAYRIPTNISSWKFGRDMERYRTIFDNSDYSSLPYEVVVYSNPSRAYLMNSNTIAVQVLVMAHVVGHSAFFKINKWFQKARIDITDVMGAANERFKEYEKIYGIDEIETLVDAGHALQLHSSPFDTETEDEKRQRVFNQKKMMKKATKAEFDDITVEDGLLPEGGVDTYNTKLWRRLREITPVEPTADLLRYIIDNSKQLEDWQKDILETLRAEGQYYWPLIRTKIMNEGFASLVHGKIMDQLFHEGLLTSTEHGQYNYSNSMVKAENRLSMNPYLVGSRMWEDVEDRWNRGRHGKEWDDCENDNIRIAWDTKEGKGWEKVKAVLETYTDWFFMQDFLTADLVDKLDLYIYQAMEDEESIKYIRTKHTAEEVRQIIINSFANSGVPDVKVVDGNFDKEGVLALFHENEFLMLEPTYCKHTMGHLYNLWGKPVLLIDRYKNKDTTYLYGTEGFQKIAKPAGFLRTI
jgi:stage V sporulation protein R